MPLVALVRWMLKNVINLEESSTDLEEIGPQGYGHDFAV